jgi:hypothetical protein
MGSRKKIYWVSKVEHRKRNRREGTNNRFNLLKLTFTFKRRRDGKREI